MGSEATATSISRRSIGTATVTVISEGTFPWNLELEAPEVAWRRAIPEANAAGEVLLGSNVVHIALGSASILVDPGFDDQAAPPPPHFPGLKRTPGLAAGLAAIGVPTDAITHVVIKHAHSDHFMGVTTLHIGERMARFPRARHLLGRAEWEGNREREPRPNASAHRVPCQPDTTVFKPRRTRVQTCVSDRKKRARRPNEATTAAAKRLPSVASNLK